MYVHTYVVNGICKGAIYTYIYIYILAEKPAFDGLHCYGAPSTAAHRRRSDDCDSMP